MIISFGHIAIALHTIIPTALDMTEINFSEKSEIEIGGPTATQLISAARCGAKTRINGYINNDSFSTHITTILRREGVQHNTLISTPGDTPIYQRIISSPDQVLHIQPKEVQTQRHLNLISDTSLNERTMLLINQEISQDDIEGFIEKRKSQKMKIALCIEDISKISTDILNNSDIVISSSPIENIKQPYICFDSKKISKTIGIDQHGQQHEITSTEIEIVDISGCFDVFCGYAAACLQAGSPLTRAMEYAHHAARICAQSAGIYNAIPYLNDVQSQMDS